MQEYMGFKKLGVLEMVQIDKGMKLMGMPTWMEYMAGLCAMMGNQQIAGIHFDKL